MAQPSSDFGGRVDRGANADIGGAAADIAVHGAVDIASVGVGLLPQQRDRAHDLAGLAIAALRHVERDPCLVHGVGLLAGQALRWW